MFNIKYNKQMDNETFLGKLKASIQCFPTSSVMFISYFDKRYELKEYETKFIDDVEAAVGKKGTAEEIKGWSGRSSAWWVVHLAAIKKVIPNQKVVYSSNTTVDKLPALLKYSPVIYSGNKIGGLPGGHIFLIVGHDPATNSFILEDPFGNPNSNYKDPNGHQVKVSAIYLKKFAAPNAIYATANMPGLTTTAVKKKV